MSLITKKINHYFLEEYSTLILYLPVILVSLFAVYAVTGALWRAYTFHDCQQGAEEIKELRQEIEEATKYLKAKGY